MPTFRVSLPPSSNAGYKLGIRYRRDKHTGELKQMSTMMKTDRLIGWEEEVQWTIRGWTPPPRTPLAVTIRLSMPRADLRRRDIDGMHKYLIDQVVGKRRDQWVDSLIIVKQPGPAFADVTVEVMAINQQTAFLEATV